MEGNDDIVSKSRVVVDGDVSRQKLATLIRLEAEEESLDYKANYKIEGEDKTKDKVELARDVVGMANTFGGYIILGVAEKTDGKSIRYEPAGLSDAECAALDISKIREQIESFVSVRTNIKFQIHTLPEFEDMKFAVIYVPPSSESPIIFEKDGQYKYPKRGENALAFQTGDIMVRKGASTERADQSDMRRLVSNLRRREKEQWTEEILGIRALVQRLDKLISLLSSSQLGGRPEELSTENGDIALAYDETLFYLSSDATEETIVTLLENNRLISIRRYLRTAPETFFKHVSEVVLDDEQSLLEIVDNRLSPILDSLLTMAVVFAEYDKVELFTDVQQSLYQICRQAGKSEVVDIRFESIVFNNIWIWQEVMIRVYAIGAYLVKRSRWEQVNSLVKQEVEWDEYYRKLYWSKYVLVMASRARQLKDKGWIPAVVKYVNDLKWLSKFFFSDSDEIAANLCQFDFLQCVYLEQNNVGQALKAYPSFGIYYRFRTEPIVSKLIMPGPLRETVLGLSDQELAAIIWDLDQAARDYFALHGGWGDYDWKDEKIVEFLSTNLPKPN